MGILGVIQKRMAGVRGSGWISSLNFKMRSGLRFGGNAELHLRNRAFTPPRGGDLVVIEVEGS